MLTEERVVVSKETVPVEKVRLDTETVTEQQEVTEAVRKEQIEFDDATGKVKIDYRPVHDFTLTNDIAPIPPKARVY